MDKAPTLGPMAVSMKAGTAEAASSNVLHVFTGVQRGCEASQLE